MYVPQAKRAIIMKGRYSVTDIESFADRPELSRHDLRLPFRIERNGKDSVALAAQKLKDRNG